MVKEIPLPPPMPLSPLLPPMPSLQDTPSLKMGRRIKATFYCAVLFVILSYNGTYRVINNLVSTLMNTPFEGVNEAGCPTTKGIFLHTVIFFVVAFFFVSNI
jgi:hypothetical protein